MLSYVDEALEAFLRAAVPLSAADIDVSFVTPDEEWSGKLTRPTVNIHLWDVRRSLTHALAGTEVFQRDGQDMRRYVLPRVEMRYFVSAWTTDPKDERSILGQALVALLANGEIPETFLPEALRELPAPLLTYATTDDQTGPTLKDGLKLTLPFIVHAVVDTGDGEVLAAPPAAIELGVNDRESGASDPAVRRVAGEVLDAAYVGATVVSPRGSGEVNATGRFLIAARPGDTVTVLGPQQLSAVVPEVGGIVIGPAGSPP